MYKSIKHEFVEKRLDVKYTSFILHFCDKSTTYLRKPISNILGFCSPVDDRVISCSPSKAPYPKSLGKDPACPSYAPFSSSS